MPLLPFVDEQRLLESLSSVSSNLTPYEGESGRQSHTEVPRTQNHDIANLEIIWLNTR